MGMLFVEVGRVVRPRDLSMRNHKAVIADIIDNKFIVVIKQDKTREVIRVDDIILENEVLDVKNIKSDFYKLQENKKSTDFERFKIKLENAAKAEIAKNIVL